VEMSVVLVVIGLLIFTVFPALTALRTNSQRALTQSNMNALMLATAAYVQANGCVPCPTPAATTGAGFGRVGGNTAGNVCTACTTAQGALLPEGIPPFASLGIAANIARDGWGRWFTMRVDPALTVAALGTVVPPTSTCTAADQVANPACTVNTNRKGLCQPTLNSSKSATAVEITTLGGAAQPAAVIFVSHGSKGYGAFVADASSLQLNGNNGSRLPAFPAGSPACAQGIMVASGVSGNAVCNANGQNQFVNAPMQDGYDDMMAFADRNSLVSMLNNGACN
jgi:type II secretory pathway pseudopilin PulG